MNVLWMSEKKEKINNIQMHWESFSCSRLKVRFKHENASVNEPNDAAH